MNLFFFFLHTPVPRVFPAKVVSLKCSRESESFGLWLSEATAAKENKKCVCVCVCVCLYVCVCVCLCKQVTGYHQGMDELWEAVCMCVCLCVFVSTGGAGSPGKYHTSRAVLVSAYTCVHPRIPPEKASNRTKCRRKPARQD